MDKRTLRNIRTSLRTIARAETIMIASRVLERAGAITAEQDSTIRLTANYDIEVQAGRIERLARILADNANEDGAEINRELTALATPYDCSGLVDVDSHGVPFVVR